MADNPQKPQQQPQQPTVADPDSVPEIFCDGQFNVSVIGNFATLTLTHARPDEAKLFKEGIIDMRAVVRARVVMTLNNLVALRDLLNRIIQEPGKPLPASGGPTTVH
jgi:hypothetical protein